MFFVCFFQTKRSSLMHEVTHLCIDTYICFSTGARPDIFSRDETVIFYNAFFLVLAHVFKVENLLPPNV